jgi:hypothetical protein
MAFGKRIALAASQPAPGVGQQSPKPAAAVLLTHPEFADRTKLLLADIARINTDAIAMARAIGSGETPRIDRSHGITAEAFPLDVSGFGRHFNFQREGKLRHGVLCYALGDDTLAREAQLHLLEMTTAILAFNKLCIRGFEDDALSIVLHSPAAMQGIDKTIVMTSLFCGLLQNLLYQNAAMAGSVGQPIRKVEASRMKNCLDDWLGKARRAMLAPDRFEQMMPDVPSPALLAEADIADHRGQLVLNQVYLPVDLAQPVANRLAAA